MASSVDQDALIWVYFSTAARLQEALVPELRCYMIVLAELTDRERFLAGYARVVPELVSRFGGRYVLRGSGGTFLEGGWRGNPSALVSEWPSREDALRFWNSTEYAAARQLREGTGRFQVLLIDSPALGPHE